MSGSSIAGVNPIGSGSISLVAGELYSSLGLKRYTIPKSTLPLLTQTDRLVRQTRRTVDQASQHHDAIILPRDVLLAGVSPIRSDALLCPIVHDLDHLSIDNTDVLYRIVLQLAKRHLRQSNLILAISERTKADLVNELDIPASAIEVFTQGINISKIYRDESEPEIDIPKSYILYVGGLLPRKRPDILVETIARLPDQNLVVCGNQYREDHIADFREKVHEHGVSDQVYIFGRVSMSELRRLYSNAAVLLHPAEHEGYGRTPVEAATCGTPTVLHEQIPCADDLGSCAVTFSSYSPEYIARLVEQTSGRCVNYEPITWSESARQVKSIIRNYVDD